MRKWSYFDVVTTMHCKQINKLAVKLSQSVPRSSGFLSAYKRACSKFEWKLPESQRQKYQVMAKEWSEKELPLRMQQRYKHGSDSSGLN